MLYKIDLSDSSWQAQSTVCSVKWKSTALGAVPVSLEMSNRQVSREAVALSSVFQLAKMEMRFEPPSHTYASRQNNSWIYPDAFT